MSFIYSPRPFTPESRRQAVASLIDNATYDRDFYVLLVGSILLAACAIFTDSIAVLIASMIVAPLAYPILALGLGIAARDWQLVGKSITILAIACAVTLLLAAVLTVTMHGEEVVDKFIAFNGNRHIAVIVAVVAGAIAAYGFVRPKVASAITGIAIAVSLMPPLVATAIGFASGRGEFALQAAILFGLNVFGILVSSCIIFWLLGVAKTYREQKETPTI